MFVLAIWILVTELRESNSDSASWLTSRTPDFQSYSFNVWPKTELGSSQSVLLPILDNYTAKTLQWITHCSESGNKRPCRFITLVLYKTLRKKCLVSFLASSRAKKEFGYAESKMNRVIVQENRNRGLGWSVIQWKNFGSWVNVTATNSLQWGHQENIKGWNWNFCVL